ncbi:MAG: MerR family transcriptional regulator [Bacteroidaceae bacterium]|nr:MerR family transcriptional regulator [Bacteroidaceae bacterium]
MAYNPNKELKKYYGISEVAEQFNVAESLLRYWEKEFPNIKPRKSGRGVRQYTKEDIEEVRIVYNLLKVRGMKIAAAKAVLNKNHKAASDTSEIIGRLQSLRTELQAISRELGELVG